MTVHIGLCGTAPKLGFVTAEEFDAIVKPEDMTHTHDSRNGKGTYESA